MESSGFFDAEELVGGGYDREYIAEQFANYFKLFIGNGVFVTPTNQLKVVADTGMKITVKEGWAFINGYWYHNSSDLSLTVPANDTAQDQTDGVFVQFDSSTREIKTVIATRSAVDRTAPKYELKLAEIAVATGATSIADANITDTRSDEEVCGFVSGVLDVIPTSDLFEQFTDAFETWFDHMKDQLDSDAAGHLQNEIGDLDELNTTNKNDLVSAVNEVNSKFDEVSSDYEGSTTVFNSDGSITVTKSSGNVETTVFNANGSITKTLKDSDNVTIATATTVFNADGSITVNATRA